ncbi:hypothetical protein LIA77_02248 [Sarocladium implicatum]|nr:hypothetical protein LIA77_02248 [Sarocladium implicatum]
MRPLISLRRGITALRQGMIPRLPHQAALKHSSTSTNHASRVDRITSKLPRRLQKYTSRLRDAPFSHVVSFLILHELTAIVPLFALFGLFHYTDLVPTAYVTNHFGGYVEAGIARFERYFSKKGWFGFGQEDDGDTQPIRRGASEEERAAHAEDVLQRSLADNKYKILTEVALAYAITKAALPIRIIGSVWATPWFAGVIVRVRGAFTRKA